MIRLYDLFTNVFKHPTADYNFFSDLFDIIRQNHGPISQFFAGPNGVVDSWARG